MGTSIRACAALLAALIFTAIGIASGDRGTLAAAVCAFLIAGLSFEMIGRDP